jgi:hypothetical protein
VGRYYFIRDGRQHGPYGSFAACTAAHAMAAAPLLSVVRGGDSGVERQGCGCLVNDPLCAVWNVNGRCVGASR